jgi:uncharacterized protein YbjT (DUF2867 family)
MFVITGATGNTGKVAAKRLLEQGQKVRVVVRDAAKAEGLKALGAEVVTADLNDRAQAERAFAGASGVYLLSPPDLQSKDLIAERTPWLEALAGAAKAAGVGHVVFLSSIGAQHAEGNGPIRLLHLAEKLFSASGLPVTFVRAAYFVENWGAVLGAAKQDGVLPSFLPADAALPMVATADIGATVAQALVDGPRGRRVIELSSTDASPNDVAKAVSALLGRDVKVVNPPLDAVVPTFTSFGVSEAVAKLFREMYEGIASGHVSWEGRGAEAVRGKQTLQDTLRGLLA